MAGAGATELLKEAAGIVKKPTTIMEQLEAMKPQIAAALPRHLTPERMIRLAITAMRTSPKLALCRPDTVLASIMISSQLGLEIGVMGQAFLVPYKRGESYICQLIPGWMGLVDLVNRAEKGSVTTGAVYRGDLFEWQLGTDPFVRHRPCGNREHLTHVYSIGKIKGSEWPVIEVFTAEHIWEHRNKINKVGEQHYSYTWPEPYARKVPLLQVIKYMPKSIEMSTALSLEAAAENGGQTISITDVPSFIEGTAVEPREEEVDFRGGVENVQHKTTPTMAQVFGKKTEPKAEPAICSDCGKKGGEHDEHCKYAAKKDTAKTEAAAAPKEEKKADEQLAPASSIYTLTKVEKAKVKDTGVEYVVLNVRNKEKQDGKLYIWHDHLKPIFSGLNLTTELEIAVEVSQQKAKNNKPYFAVEHVHRIGSVLFVDDKPAATDVTPEKKMQDSVENELF